MVLPGGGKDREESDEETQQYDVLTKKSFLYSGFSMAYFVTTLLQANFSFEYNKREVKGHVHPPFKEERSACFHLMMDLS